MQNQIIQSDLTNIAVAIYTSKGNGYSVEPICEQHFHDELELIYITEGVFHCISNGISYLCYPGDILFVSSRIRHQTESLAEPTHYRMLQFDASDFSGEALMGISKYLLRFINLGNPPIVVFQTGEHDTGELATYMDTIFSEYHEKRPAYELYIKANILNIIAFLSRSHVLTDSSLVFQEANIRKIMPALNYIDSHYNEQITLQEICGILNLNPSYFCRLFKKATKATFIEYLNFVRICKSEKMLSSSGKKISDISLDLGFSSVAYFNKIFKKIKGCAPTEYKKSRYAVQ